MTSKTPDSFESYKTMDGNILSILSSQNFFHLSTIGIPTQISGLSNFRLTTDTLSVKAICQVLIAYQT